MILNNNFELVKVVSVLAVREKTETLIQKLV